MSSGETPQRSLRISDEDWAEIKRRADEAGDLDRTEYILRKALAPPTRTDALRGAISRIGELAVEMAQLCAKVLGRVSGD